MKKIDKYRKLIQELSGGNIYLKSMGKLVASKDSVLVDLRDSEEFTYSVESAISILRRDKEHTFSRAKTLTPMELIYKLSEGRYCLETYTASREVCILRNTASGEIIEVVYDYAAKALTADSKHIFREVNSTEEIQALSEGRFIVKTHNGREPSILLDTKTDREFSTRVSDALRILRKNPNHEFPIASFSGKAGTDDYYTSKVAALSSGRYAYVRALGGGMSLWRDTASGVSFKVQTSCALHRLTKDSTYKFSWALKGLNADPIKSQKKDILALSHGRLELLDYRGAYGPVEVRDTRTGIRHSYGMFSNFRAKLKADPEFIPNDTTSSIEYSVKDLLSGINYIHNKTLPGVTYRPDFLIPDHKLIIECDGIYWHSDKFLSKNYHKEKLKAYEDLGYTALFFREDEIRNSLSIVDSIIKNKLGLSKKIYARKCTLGTTTKSFFEENHLMGNGSGKVFALIHEGEPVAALQVRWKRKGKVLDISRFCTKVGTNVVGGFSKLLRAVEKEYHPPIITNFVDRRYGQGKHLESLGFIKETEYPSFRWVDTTFNTTYHRLRYRGNIGTVNGLYRIWDCGQAKYVKVTDAKAQPEDES